MGGSDLLCEGGELEDIERLVEAGRVLVDVHHHADPTGTTEEELQEVGQLGLPEGNVVLEPAERRQSRWISISGCLMCVHRDASRSEVLLGVLVEPHGADALPERQQGAVDVSRLLQPLPGVVSP